MNSQQTKLFNLLLTLHSFPSNTSNAKLTRMINSKNTSIPFIDYSSLVSKVQGLIEKFSIQGYEYISMKLHDALRGFMALSCASMYTDALYMILLLSKPHEKDYIPLNKIDIQDENKDVQELNQLLLKDLIISNSNPIYTDDEDDYDEEVEEEEELKDFEYHVLIKDEEKKNVVCQKGASTFKKENLIENYKGYWNHRFLTSVDVPGINSFQDNSWKYCEYLPESIIIKEILILFSGNQFNDCILFDSMGLIQDKYQLLSASHKTLYELLNQFKKSAEQLFFLKEIVQEEGNQMDSIRQDCIQFVKDILVIFNDKLSFLESTTSSLTLLQLKCELEEAFKDIYILYPYIYTIMVQEYTNKSILDFFTTEWITLQYLDSNLKHTFQCLLSKCIESCLHQIQDWFFLHYQPPFFISIHSNPAKVTLLQEKLPNFIQNSQEWKDIARMMSLFGDTPPHLKIYKVSFDLKSHWTVKDLQDYTKDLTLYYHSQLKSHYESLLKDLRYQKHVENLENVFYLKNYGLIKSFATRMICFNADSLDDPSIVDLRNWFICSLEEEDANELKDANLRDFIEFKESCVTRHCILGKWSLSYNIPSELQSLITQDQLESYQMEFKKRFELLFELTRLEYEFRIQKPSINKFLLYTRKRMELDEMMHSF